jgi:ADP-heptose:LPS heptosyltransferase
MLVAWMPDNNMKTWSERLRFIKKTKKRALHSSIKTSPYEIIFGTEQRIGLADSPFTEDMYSSIETEEELEQLFNSGMKSDRDKEEANQQATKDEDENQTNETSEETMEKNDDKKVYCVICKESSGAHKCSVCDQFFHAICGRQ